MTQAETGQCRRRIFLEPCDSMFHIVPSQDIIDKQSTCRNWTLEEARKGNVWPGGVEGQKLDLQTRRRGCEPVRCVNDRGLKIKRGPGVSGGW